MDELVNGLPDDLTFSVSQNLTEPRNRCVFLLSEINLSSNHTLCCMYPGASVNENAECGAVGDQGKSEQNS